jgi:hypothetical protein
MDLDLFLCMTKFSTDLYEPFFRFGFLAKMPRIRVLKYYLLPFTVVCDQQMNIIYYLVFSTELLNSDHLIFVSPNVTGTGKERKGGIG